MVMKIDPRDLTEKQARLLEAFFAQEEQNDKDNKEPGNLRIKRYTKNVTYQVGNKKFLLTSGLTRRKKRYDRIVVLGPDQSIPLLRNRKKSTLYFKKVHFKKVGDCILVQA
ncbi:MAG TPA: hypothetical protein VLI69_07380, partial [Gammaproteobacteria bacterium]|nr:hypothetical protein [Gammaproteobacteria bacterium]